MTVRKIFVRHGDFVIVHVIDDEDESLNMKGWQLHKPRPFKFSFLAEKARITFNDPDLDIGLQQGTEKRTAMQSIPIPAPAVPAPSVPDEWRPAQSAEVRHD